MDPSDELGELSSRALSDTEAAKTVLKEIAVLSGKVKQLQSALEQEREHRAALETRLAALETRSEQ